MRPPNDVVATYQDLFVNRTLRGSLRSYFGSLTLWCPPHAVRHVLVEHEDSPSLRSDWLRRDPFHETSTHCHAWSELIVSDLLMRLALVLVLLWSAPSSLLSVAQEAHQQPAGNPKSDSFQILSVSPSPDTQLRGNQAEFRARVRYTLDSMEKAILMVNAE